MHMLIQIKKDYFFFYPDPVSSDWPGFNFNSILISILFKVSVISKFSVFNNTENNNNDGTKSNNNNPTPEM